jgi:hypothetical protein
LFFESLRLGRVFDQGFDQGSQIPLPGFLKVASQRIGGLLVHFQGFHHQFEFVTGRFFALDLKDGVGEFESGFLIAAILVESGQGSQHGGVLRVFGPEFLQDLSGVVGSVLFLVKIGQQQSGARILGVGAKKVLNLFDRCTRFSLAQGVEGHVHVEVDTFGIDLMDPVGDLVSEIGPLGSQVKVSQGSQGVDVVWLFVQDGEKVFLCFFGRVLEEPELGELESDRQIVGLEEAVPA